MSTFPPALGTDLGVCKRRGGRPEPHPPHRPHCPGTDKPFSGAKADNAKKRFPVHDFLFLGLGCRGAGRFRCIPWSLACCLRLPGGKSKCTLVSNQPEGDLIKHFLQDEATGRLRKGPLATRCPSRG